MVDQEADCSLTVLYDDDDVLSCAVIRCRAQAGPVAITVSYSGVDLTSPVEDITQRDECNNLLTNLDGWPALNFVDLASWDLNNLVDVVLVEWRRSHHRFARAGLT